MKEKCCDEATIQSFLDGELAPVLAENVACHIAECETCLMLVEAVEAENAFVFDALNNEFNVSVPTEKIWANINNEIKETKVSWWKKIFGLTFLPEPSMVLVATFLIFATIFGLYLNFKKDDVQTIAKKDEAKKVEIKQVEPNPIPTETPNKVEPILPKIETVSNQNKPKRTIEQPKFVIEKAVYRPEPEPKKIEIKNKKTNIKDQNPKAELPKFIDGEETYVKTISTLSKNVGGEKLNNIRPTARINYERNMAIVDDAIGKMRKQIRKNPKDETAKQILFASYQNKIDLLNSINEKNEMIATIR
jgi:hypothetical protein